MTLGARTLFENASFQVNYGDRVALVGPNGAGKTTTMRIISTIEEPTSGDVLLNGISVCEEPELARQLEPAAVAYA